MSKHLLDLNHVLHYFKEELHLSVLRFTSTIILTGSKYFFFPQKRLRKRKSQSGEVTCSRAPAGKNQNRHGFKSRCL